MTKTKKQIQYIIGSLLYYACAVDHTMLVALNELASEQATPTANTLRKTRKLLDYAATYPNAILHFHASDMVLHVDSDAEYLVMPQARSRIAGYYYLSDDTTTFLKKKQPSHNAPTLVECKTLRHVVASATEAETGGIFHNAQMAISIRQVLETLGHPQPTTTIKTDNTTAKYFVTKTLHRKQFKSWDMRYHWLQDRVNQQQFKVYWDRGLNNMGPKYIHTANHINKLTCEHIPSPHLRGCVTLRDSNGLSKLADVITRHVTCLVSQSLVRIVNL